MIEMMVELISSSSNVHIVVVNSNNCYKSMIIDVMRMNQGYVNEYSIIDEELNADATRFF
jgi:sugar-specific transcriptional regulator TrmB